MSVGLSLALANSVLNFITNSGAYSFTAKLHLDDPGAAGTSNPAATTATFTVTFSPSTTGALTVATVSADITAAANETFTHLSLWRSGVFQWSAALATPLPRGSGDPVSLNGVTFLIPSTAIAA